jgi:hypothetical protein
MDSEAGFVPGSLPFLGNDPDTRPGPKFPSFFFFLLDRTVRTGQQRPEGSGGRDPGGTYGVPRTGLLGGFERGGVNGKGSRETERSETVTRSTTERQAYITLCRAF